MFKLPYHCTHFICQQGYAQSPSSQASAVHELRIFKCTSWVQKKQRNQRANANICWRKQGSSRKTSTSSSLTMLKPLTVWNNKLQKILQEIGMPDHLTCLLRNLYAGQEATVRTGHGTTDWLQIRKGVRQGCMLFNLYAEYIM